MVNTTSQYRAFYNRYHPNKYKLKRMEAMTSTRSRGSLRFADDDRDNDRLSGKGMVMTS